MVYSLTPALSLDGLMEISILDYPDTYPWSFGVNSFHDVLPRGVLSQELGSVLCYFSGQAHDVLLDVHQHRLRSSDLVCPVHFGDIG